MASESAPVAFVSPKLWAQACPCELPSSVDLLEQPGHIWAEDLADQDEVVDRVEGVHGPGPADRVKVLSARLSLESLWAGCIMVNMNTVQEAEKLLRK